MNDVEKQRMAEHFAVPGPMDRIRQKHKGERAYTNDEIAEHENLAAEIRAKLDDYQPERMRAALAALRGGAQSALRLDLKAARDAVRDEVGSRLCHLTPHGTLICSRQSSSTCLCEETARAALCSQAPVTEGMRAPSAAAAHASDCAIHNGPALPTGPCDCGVGCGTPGCTDPNCAYGSGIPRCQKCGTPIPPPVAASVVEALDNLVNVIEAAGLYQLSTGVELGPTVWYVKASDALTYAKDVLAVSSTQRGTDNA